MTTVLPVVNSGRKHLMTAATCQRSVAGFPEEPIRAIYMPPHHR